ncbi:hypothetical protein SJI19_08445 [Acerihabitans sp. TG2]|nr:hypothetical protein [Acerihabitans sp. TG2]MEA9390569.1 hypothetical protein [Acerihabitans sp. TG2]
MMISLLCDSNGIKRRFGTLLPRYSGAMAVCDGRSAWYFIRVAADQLLP